jgi:tetratricopeptide (TPR) repeat protein
VAAYDAFLKGRALFNADGGEESDRAALAQFDAAIAADPNYADAYAARSRSLVAIANQYAKSEEARALYEDAIRTAKRATSLAPDLAAAQLSLGQAYSTGRLDVASATGPFSRAAALGAGDADIQILYAVFCARSGKAKESIEASTRAMDLDRLNPLAFRAGGLVQYLAHNYLQAIPLLQKALQLNAKLRNANGNIGHSLLKLGKFVEARASYLLEPASLLRLPGLAIVEKKLGNASAGDQAMAQLVSELGDNAVYQQAQVLAQWGNTKGALDALRRAKVVGDAGLLQAGVDPLLEPIQTNPDFKQLIDGGFKR